MGMGVRDALASSSMCSSVPCARFALSAGNRFTTTQPVRLSLSASLAGKVVLHVMHAKPGSLLMSHLRAIQDRLSVTFLNALHSKLVYHQSRFSPLSESRSLVHFGAKVSQEIDVAP